MEDERIRVLHVDDELNDRELTEIYLHQHMPALELISAPDAATALEILASKHVDCILSDYQMPGMDGLEFLKTLRDNGNDLPFIFLTGQGNEQTAATALRIGADDYYSKHEGIAHYERLVNSIRRMVTAYREKQQRVRLENQMLQFGRMLDESHDEIYVVDAEDLHFLQANKRGLENLQYSLEDLQNLSPLDIVVEKAEFDFLAKKQMLTEKATGRVTFKVTHRRKDGTTYPVEARVQLMEIGGEQVLLGIVTDLSKHKTEQEKLRQVTSRLLEQTNELQSLIELSRLIAGKKKALEKICDGALACLVQGLSSSGAVSAWLTLFDSEYRTADFSLTGLSHSEVIQVHGHASGAIEVWFHETEKEIGENARLLISVFAERLGRVYERIELEDQVNELRQMIEQKHGSEPGTGMAMPLILNDSAVVMLIIDPHSGVILDANRAACGFYGYSRAQITQMNIADINQLSPEQVEAERISALKTKRNYFLFPHKDSSGKVHQVEVYSSPVRYNGTDALLSIIHELKDSKKVIRTLKHTVSSGFLGETLEEVWNIDEAQLSVENK